MAATEIAAAFVRPQPLPASSAVFFGVEPIETVEDAHEAGHSRLTRPIALKLAIHLNTADELPAGLLGATQRRLVRGERGAANRIDRHIDVSVGRRPSSVSVT